MQWLILLWSWFEEFMGVPREYQRHFLSKRAGSQCKLDAGLQVRCGVASARERNEPTLTG